MQVSRFEQNPIITSDMDRRIGTNINGPSLIRVPDWLPNPLGQYYLYFAHHKGRFIRLAYADALTGPWHIHGSGTLQLEHSHFTLTPPPRSALANISSEPTAETETDRLTPHIASPDVYVDEERRKLRMYYHGLLADGTQLTRLALSRDGLSFSAREEILSLSYLRVFQYDGYWFGIAMPGTIYRSQDGLTAFERGHQVLDDNARHVALRQSGNTLQVFWTRVGDAPERILCSTIDLAPDWTEWSASTPVEVLRPEMDWEGAHLPNEPSLRGAINEPVNQLRDPCVFTDNDGSDYLVYVVAGENGIAIASLSD